MLKLNVFSLKSSSAGNCVLYRFSDFIFMIDFGISVKYFEKCLKELEIDVNSVKFVFISHEHSDHASGIRALVSKYPYIQIITTPGTKKALIEKHKIEENLFITYEYLTDFKLGELNFSLVPTIHDAAEPCGVFFWSGNEKYVHITDTGSLPSTTTAKIKGSQFFFIEGNYDYNLLKNSKRPLSLKQRIASDYGHLSNQQAACLVEILRPREEKCFWFIGHISQECNSRQAIESALVECISDPTNLDFKLADSKKITKVVF